MEIKLNNLKFTIEEIEKSLEFSNSLKPDIIRALIYTIQNQKSLLEEYKKLDALNSDPVFIKKLLTLSPLQQKLYRKFAANKKSNIDEYTCKIILFGDEPDKDNTTMKTIEELLDLNLINKEISYSHGMEYIDYIFKNTYRFAQLTYYFYVTP